MVDLSGASLTFTADVRGFFGDGDGDAPWLPGSSGEGVESADAFFLCNINNIRSIHTHVSYECVCVCIHVHVYCMCIQCTCEKTVL